MFLAKLKWILSLVIPCKVPPSDNSSTSTENGPNGTNGAANGGANDRRFSLCRTVVSRLSFRASKMVRKGSASSASSSSAPRANGNGIAAVNSPSPRSELVGLVSPNMSQLQVLNNNQGYTVLCHETAVAAEDREGKPQSPGLTLASSLVKFVRRSSRDSGGGGSVVQIDLAVRNEGDGEVKRSKSESCMLDVSIAADISEV